MYFGGLHGNTQKMSVHLLVSCGYFSETYMGTVQLFLGTTVTCCFHLPSEVIRGTSLGELRSYESCSRRWTLSKEDWLWSGIKRHTTGQPEPSFLLSQKSTDVDGLRTVKESGNADMWLILH